MCRRGKYNRYRERLTRASRGIRAAGAVREGERAMGWRIGVDIGGTFTDVAVLDEASGRAGIAKVSTTPRDFGAAVIEGTRAAMDGYRIAPDSVTLLSHAHHHRHQRPPRVDGGERRPRRDARLSRHARAPALRAGGPV